MREELDPLVTAAAPDPTRPVDPDQVWHTARRRNRRFVAVSTAAIVAVAALAVATLAPNLVGPGTGAPVVEQPEHDATQPPTDAPTDEDEEPTDAEPPEPDSQDPDPVEHEEDPDPQNPDTVENEEDPDPQESGPGEDHEAPDPQEQTVPDQSAEQLWGRMFVSVAVSESGEPRPLVGDSRIELTFDDGGTDRNLRWWAGCNHHGSRDLELTDRHLAVGQIAGSDADCDPPELKEQDEWFNDLLRTGVAWRLDAERLVLEADQTRIELVQAEEGSAD